MEPDELALALAEELADCATAVEASANTTTKYNEVTNNLHMNPSF